MHTVLGAFVAGVLIGESPILTRHIDEQLRGLIVAFFMPVFFGTRRALDRPDRARRIRTCSMLAVGLIAIASIGKFAGAFIGGEIGGLDRREALALGCGMNARGSTEVIVATVGLSMGALTQNLFTMIVAMAFVTTMAMPPMLRWALARVPMTEEERERLEREEFEEKGFVSNIERLLVAADDSPNGKFAAQLAGFIAGRRGTPTTVLSLDKPAPAAPPATPSGARDRGRRRDGQEPGRGAGSRRQRAIPGRSGRLRLARLRSRCASLKTSRPRRRSLPKPRRATTCWSSGRRRCAPAVAALRRRLHAS